MKDLKKLFRILKEKRLEKGYTLRQVESILNSRGYNYTYSHIKKIEDGLVQKIEAENLKGLTQIYGLDLNETFKLAGFIDNDVIVNDNFMSIPLYGFASAGKGYINFDETIKILTFPKINNKISKNSFVTIVKGDSMEPYYNNGDMIVVNPDYCTDIELLNKKECVVDYDGERYLKRLLFNNGDLILRSYNEVYKDITVPNERLDEVFCCGVVTMSLNMKI